MGLGPIPEGLSRTSPLAAAVTGTRHRLGGKAGGITQPHHPPTILNFPLRIMVNPALSLDGRGKRSGSGEAGRRRAPAGGGRRQTQARTRGAAAEVRRSNMRGKGRARMEEDGRKAGPLEGVYDAPALLKSSPLRVAVKGGMGMPLVVD